MPCSYAHTALLPTAPTRCCHLLCADDHFLSPGGFGLFRSPAFGSMVTPPWAKSGSSGGSKTAPRTGPHSGQASLGGDGGEAEEEGEGGDLERRHSVARRLDSAPSFGSLAAAGIAASAAAAAAAGWQQQQPQQQQPVGGGSLEPAGSFDFGTVLGSPPKKSKVGTGVYVSSWMRQCGVAGGG